MQMTMIEALNRGIAQELERDTKVVVFGQDIPVTATGKYKRLELKPLFEAYRATQFREPR